MLMRWRWLRGLRAVCVIRRLSIEKARFLHQLSIDANKVSYVHEKRVQLWREVHAWWLFPFFALDWSLLTCMYYTLVREGFDCICIRPCNECTWLFVQINCDWCDAMQVLFSFPFFDDCSCCSSCHCSSSFLLIVYCFYCCCYSTDVATEGGFISVPLSLSSCLRSSTRLTMYWFES